MTEREVAKGANGWESHGSNPSDEDGWFGHPTAAGPDALSPGADPEIDSYQHEYDYRYGREGQYDQDGYYTGGQDGSTGYREQDPYGDPAQPGPAGYEPGYEPGYDDQWDEPDDNLWDDNQAIPTHAFDTDRFDSYGATRWDFKPAAPTPWYRTKQATVALIATALAAVALVVSGVLLLFGGLPGPGSGAEATTSPAATTSVAPASPPRTSRPVPPPPPPPPPSTEAPAPANRAPTYWPPQTRQTNKPEIGVTRTPVTRSPISVAPQPRTPAR